VVINIISAPASVKQKKEKRSKGPIPVLLCNLAARLPLISMPPKETAAVEDINCLKMFDNSSVDL
jgi:hypothetical protein